MILYIEAMDMLLYIEARDKLIYIEARDVLLHIISITGVETSELGALDSCNCKCKMKLATEDIGKPKDM